MCDCPKHPNVPPELYNLTDLLIGYLECARDIAHGIMKAQLQDRYDDERRVAIGTR